MSHTYKHIFFNNKRRCCSNTFDIFMLNRQSNCRAGVAHKKHFIFLHKINSLEITKKQTTSFMYMILFIYVLVCVLIRRVCVCGLSHELEFSSWQLRRFICVYIVINALVLFTCFSLCICVCVCLNSFTQSCHLCQMKNETRTPYNYNNCPATVHITRTYTLIHMQSRKFSYAHIHTYIHVCNIVAASCV